MKELTMAERLLAIKEATGKFPTMVDLVNGQIKISRVELHKTADIYSIWGRFRERGGIWRERKYLESGKRCATDVFPSLYWPGTVVNTADAPKVTKKACIELSSVPGIVMTNWSEHDGIVSIELFGIDRVTYEALVETGKIMYEIQE